MSLTVIGHITGIDDDGGLSDIDALSEHFQSKPYPDRDRP